MDNTLENWRKQIDTIDQEILMLLAKRLNFAKKIGQYKKQHGLSPLDKQRWRSVLESNLGQAKSLNLSEDFIKRLFTIIHKYSLKAQKEIGKL